MKKLLALLLFPLLMQACTKGGGSEDVITPKEPKAAEKKMEHPNQVDAPDARQAPRGFIITAHLDLRVSDAQGNDLLDPTIRSPKAVDLSKVKVYYVKDGKEELFYHENLAAARGFLLLPPEGTRLPYYSIRLFFNIESKEEVTTTILEWEDGHRDVFKVALYRTSNRISQRSIWLNGVLIWDLPKRIGVNDTDYKFTR